MKQTLPLGFLLLFYLASPFALSYASPHVAFPQTQNFVSLTVESTGWSAELFWNAVFDHDLVEFAVQRSNDGLEYEDIIRYDSYFMAAGNIQTFREQDPNPNPGDNYYRIRFTLANGQEIFSNRSKVYFKEIAAFEIFPNPTGRQVSLILKRFRGKPVDILIFDGIGDQVYEQHVAAVDEGIFRIELNVMNPGVYSVCVVHGGRTYTRRLVVTRAENN